MGEYIGRIHEQVKGRPLYLVKDSLGWNAAGNPGVIPFRTSLSPLPAAWHPEPLPSQRAG